MKWIPLGLAGAYRIEMQATVDERGFFARSWCEDEARAHGANPHVAQCNVSHNLKRGIIRGLHYQPAPHQEAKLVRCVTGAIFDVIVDLRPDSATYGRWEGHELTHENRSALYVPEGLAHGFQVLRDNSEVFYQMSVPFVPGIGLGVRFDDPALAIVWPVPNPIISEKDGSLPRFAR